MIFLESVQTHLGTMSEYPGDESDESDVPRPDACGPMDAELSRVMVPNGHELSEIDMDAPAVADAVEEGLDALEGTEQPEGATVPSKEPFTVARVRARRTRFLATLRQCGNIRLACKKAQVGRSTVDFWRKKEPWFSEQYEQALADWKDLVDLRAKQMAVEGLMDPVYHEGRVVGYRRIFSERLLLRLAENACPETWGSKGTGTRSSQSDTDAQAPEGKLDPAAVEARVKGLVPLLTARHVATLQGKAPDPFRQAP